MHSVQNTEPRIAVLIPCYNEALTVEKVVRDFKEQLPTAQVFVYDNNSTDDTAARARAVGAVVVHEKRQGKGFVLQSMFMDIDADFYVLTDGDDTYPADKVHTLLAPLLNNRADVVIGTRLTEYEDKSFRRLHVLGNRLVIRCINLIFNANVRDVMSGYRAFTREFARCIPVVSKGFEIETELTIQALYRNMVLVEVPIRYGKRPTGSFSKLNTFRDGARVLLRIFHLFRAYRPLLFFSIFAGLFALAGLILGAVPITEYFRTGLVPHFPTAILAAALEIVAMVTFVSGIVLDSINHHFKELSQLVLKAGARSRYFVRPPQLPASVVSDDAPEVPQELEVSEGN
jgi:glycosyltransferase involved in cell wall biosynthesis